MKEAYKHILLIALCLLIHSAQAEEKSHLQKNVTLAVQDASIPQLLESVSRQCKCYFSYPSDLFTTKKKRITSPYQGTLADFITEILGHDISYRCYKNQIILQRSNTLNEEKDEAAKPSYNYISAQIRDSNTMKVIPYASILLEDTRLGTSANSEGQFGIKLAQGQGKQRIQISCLGYYTQSYSAEELLEKQEIYLSPSNISLQEVIVRSVGSHYVVDKAVNNFKSKYRKEAYSYTTFYREMAYRNKDQLSYIEALFQAYSPRNKGMRQDDLVLQKARKFSPAPSQQDSLILKLKGGTDAALRLDIARYPTDFLSATRDELYRFQIVDIETWKEEVVYVIHFSPISDESAAQFEGELYISFEDYILLGAEFSYTASMLNALKYQLIVSKDRRTRVKPEQYHYHVEYQSFDSLYHLNYIRGDILIKAKNRNAWRYQDFHTTFEMVLTAMHPTANKKPKHTTKHKSNSVFSDAVEFSPAAYWASENVIIPERAIMAAFKKSGFVVEEESDKTFWLPNN